MAAAAGGSTLSSRRRRDSDRDHERERDRDVDRNPYRSAVRRNRLYQQQQEQLASQARGGNPFYAGNSIIDDDIGYHHRDESPPRAKDSVLAGLNGSGHGMDRVYEWRVHVEPGVPEGDVTGAMGPIRITS